MVFGRRKLTPVSDETIQYLRGIVATWAGTAGNPRQVTLERQEAEHLQCVVTFHDRPDFTVLLLSCTGAERFGIEAELIDALNEATPNTLEIFVSSLVESVAIEAERAPG